MLSWARGFVNLYKNKDLSFDKTYFELAVALDGRLLKGEALEKASTLSNGLERAIEGKVFRNEDGGFYLSFNNISGEIESTIVATGINKLAQIVYLIKNGSLTKDTVLFWDEPETGLNPKYITLVTKFLITLANAGCQIFVSTHDYLLTHQLSLFAENRDVEKDVPPMRFFALTKGENGTEVEAADTVAEIQSNAILEEYAAYHELQMELAAKRFQTT
jgi:predicted ATPase